MHKAIAEGVATAYEVNLGGGIVANDPPLAKGVVLIRVAHERALPRVAFGNTDGGNPPIVIPDPKPLSMLKRMCPFVFTFKPPPPPRRRVSAERVPVESTSTDAVGQYVNVSVTVRSPATVN